MCSPNRASEVTVTSTGRFNSDERSRGQKIQRYGRLLQTCSRRTGNQKISYNIEFSHNIMCFRVCFHFGVVTWPIVFGTFRLKPSTSPSKKNIKKSSSATIKIPISGNGSQECLHLEELQV